MRLRLELGRGNEAAQVAPLQALVASPRTAPDAVGPYNARLNFLLGRPPLRRRRSTPMSSTT